MSLDRVWGKVVIDYLKNGFNNTKDLFNKSFSEGGVYFLSSTDAAPVDVYYGFLVISETVIASISPIDASKLGGTPLTPIYPAGIFISIPGKFSTITLTSGDIMLVKY